VESIMQAIVEPRNLLSIAVAVLVFATLATLFGSMGGGVKLDERMKAVSVRRDELKRRSRQAIASGQGGLRHTDDGFKKRVVDQLNLTKMLEDPKVAEQMIQAGFRGPRPLTTFYFFRFATPFVFLFLVGGYLFLVNDFGQPFTMKLAGTVGAAVAGFYAPNVFLQNRIAKRRQSIMEAFPDALDLMMICAEAGLSLAAMLDRVSSELGRMSPVLAEEFSLTSVELGFLPERSTGLKHLGERVDIKEVRGLVNVILQTEKYGTPIAQALRTLAKSYRTERMLRAEQKAARLPALMTVPMIVFILPALFVIVLAPAVIGVMDTMK
jgi:tight adherence protein C